MLFAFAGINGSGKSTQIEMLRKFLEKKGYDIFISKAYQGTLRKNLNPVIENWDDLAISFLFQGFHRQQYVEAAKALKEKKIVLADRWDETFLSFHSNYGLLSKDKKMKQQWNKLAFGGLVPDLTFFFDISPKEALARINKRGGDFLDKGGESYYRSIRRSTIEALSGRPAVFIDGSKSRAEINKIVVSEVSKKLKIPGLIS